jgi:hypothetical protein
MGSWSVGGMGDCEGFGGVWVIWGELRRVWGVWGGCGLVCGEFGRDEVACERGLECSALRHFYQGS